MSTNDELMSAVRAILQTEGLSAEQQLRALRELVSGYWYPDAIITLVARQGQIERTR